MIAWKRRRSAGAWWPRQRCDDLGCGGLETGFGWPIGNLSSPTVPRPAARLCPGIQAAKKRGVRLGRRPSLAAAQIDHARSFIERGESPRAVARTMRVGKSTLYRAFKPSCTGRCIVRHLDRFAEMGDPLLEGRAAQSLVARLERLRLHIDLPWRWSCIPNPSRRLNPLAQLS
jgi:hypothetical protein